jgi:hypothetical protein
MLKMSSPTAGFMIPCCCSVVSLGARNPLSVLCTCKAEEESGFDVFIPTWALAHNIHIIKMMRKDSGFIKLGFGVGNH